MSTEPVVGGVVAASLNVTVLGKPVNVAVTVCRVEDPIESTVVATPFALLVLWVGLTAPPPEATFQVTTMFGTGFPSASSTVTDSIAGRGLLKYQFCASPALFTSWVGGPGGLVPPLPPPPHAPSNSAAPTAALNLNIVLTVSPPVRESPPPGARRCARSRRHARSASARAANPSSCPPAPPAVRPPPKPAPP